MKKDKVNPKIYDYEALREERKYGFYWYNILWQMLRPFCIFFISLMIVVGILVSVGYKIDSLYFSPVNSKNTASVSFLVKKGNSLTTVSNNLEEQGLIKNRSVFKYYCDFAGFGQKILAGKYTLNASMNMFEIVDTLTLGDGLPTVTNITLVPGMNIEEMANYLVEKGLFEGDANSFLSICKNGKGVLDYYFVKEALNTTASDQRLYLLEGYLAPNTYEVYLDATPLSIIKKLLSQTDKVFSAEWQKRASELHMTMDQVLTLASIIEKEAKNPDFTKVSAVFHNRVKKGMPLQSDVTVHYITHERRMVLRNSDLAITSPYNTYTNNGLPLGPITNPSPEAIHAALYPDEGYIAEGYYYFCSKEPDSGELYFSQTLQEHERAVAIYEPLWKTYDQERGYE